MNKLGSRVCLAILIAVYLCSFIYSIDLKQTNTEKIFLTEESLIGYEEFLVKGTQQSLAIVKINKINILSHLSFDEEIAKLSEFCQDDDCNIISPKHFANDSSPLLKLQNKNSFALLLIDHNQGEYIKEMIKRMKSNPFWESKTKRLQISGIPYTNLNLDRYSKSIKEKLFPFFFILSFVFLLIIFKNFKTAAFLFIPCLGSSFITLALLKLIFYQSNLILAILPLMMFILNMSLLFHVFYTRFHISGFKEAIVEKKRPITLMVLTTFIGLSSLGISDILVIRQFGIASALLLLISSLISLGWCLLLDKAFANKLQSIESESPKVLNKVTTPFSLRTIIILSIASLIIGISAFPKIPILTDAIKYFPFDSNIEKDMQDISREYIGVPLVQIEVQGIDKKISNLKALTKFEQTLAKEVSNAYKIISANKIVLEANKTYTQKEIIPDNIYAYQALLSRAPSFLSHYSNLENYRITILGPSLNIDDYESLIQKIKAISLKHNVSLSFNGLYYHLMTAQKAMIHTLFKSFFGTLLIIALISFVVFRKIKIFFTILLVNIVPVLMTFIFYYLAGISLNIASVMTFSISLGIIVDSTFHQIDALTTPHFNRQLYELKVVRPIILSAIVLSSCFFFFLWNEFLPIRHFGVSLSFIILIGAVFDLKVLPSLIKASENQVR